ncbi:HpcH/HpaI aldolase family protein [Arthrobacter antioxidans]|uniref:HpcH/HpaI aldolase family protein n=1 Tax=Arthrobacter antioxidans TaxID=2895818 RepID=UPI001FFFC064|nr:aldolase/citrate lyase family protein [Arthrobacter antioxidans]
MTNESAVHDPLLGVWATLGEPRLTTELARSGVGWVALDLQHGHFDDRSVRDALGRRAADTAPMLVRVAANDAALIGRALDAGADGVVVPLVNGVADAEAAVAASHYPPRGARSWGPLPGSRAVHGPGSDDAPHAVPLCAVMIETMAALEAVEAIAAVPGVDMIFVGPFDLSLALGLDVDELLSSPEDDAPLRRIARTCRQAGIRAGAYAGSSGRAALLAAAGFDWIAAATDTGLLALGVQALRTQARTGRPDQSDQDAFSSGNASS